MERAYWQDGSWHPIDGPFSVGDGDAAIHYPACWTDAPAIEVQETDQPDDAIVTGSTIADVDGVPTRQWTSTPITLTDLQADLKRQAETIRDGHINGGCDTPHGRVDTDRESRLNISGSVQMAAILGAAFTTSWRRADNSYVTLDATAMIAVGMAAGGHVATCYGACFAIKDAIDAATTRTAARSLDLTAGYP